MHDEIFIDGVGTWTDLGLELLMSPEMDPPEVITHYVDIPGGPPLDLSEAYGDVAYGHREQVYELLLSARSPSAIEREKTRLSRLFHGRACDFTLSWDPGYTYHGRWTIDEYHNDRRAGTVKLHVVADPYKTAGEVTFRINGAGGVRVRLPSGRCRVQPTIELYRQSVVSYEGRTWRLDPGTWRLEDLWFHLGDNVLCVDTTPEYSHATLDTYRDDTLQAHASEMLARLAAGSEPLQEPTVLSEIATQQLWDIEAARLIDLCHPVSTVDDSYNVYCQYPIKEL